MNEWVKIKSQRNHWGWVRCGELEQGQNFTPVLAPPSPTTLPSDLEAGRTADSCLDVTVFRVMTQLQLSPSGALGQTRFLPEHTQVRGRRSREHTHATQIFCYIQHKITCSAPVPAHSHCQKLCLCFLPTGILATRGKNSKRF